MFAEQSRRQAAIEADFVHWMLEVDAIDSALSEQSVRYVDHFYKRACRDAGGRKFWYSCYLKRMTPQRAVIYNMDDGISSKDLAEALTKLGAEWTWIPEMPPKIETLEP